MLALRVCGIPYLIPTPTLGNALITFLTVLWSGKANIIDVRDAKNNSSAVFCNKYLREKIARISEKYHLPWR